MKAITLVNALAIFVIAGLGMAGCESSVEPKEKPSLPDQAELDASFHYTFRGDTLLVVESACECDGNELDRQPRLSTYILRLTSDSTLQIQSTVLESINVVGADVSIWLNYIRQNDGDSLEGVWMLVGPTFTSTELLNSEDSANVEQKMLDTRGIHYKWVYITSNSIAFYEDNSAQKTGFVESYLKNWEEHYSHRVDINISKYDYNTVQLIGVVSEDTVYIRRESNGDRRYWRLPENSDYPDYTYYRWPTKEQCPNNLYPMWFEDAFLVANKKSS